MSTNEGGSGGRPEPAPSPGDETIERLVEYVSATDRGFPDALRGASPVDVGTVRSLAGLALPPTYLSFLERLGDCYGGFRPFSETAARIGDVIGYYRAAAEEGVRVSSTNAAEAGASADAFAAAFHLRRIP